MGDAKCGRCGRGTDIERRDDYCAEATIRPLGVTSTLGERECTAIARVRAPLDAQIATLTRERDAAIAEAAGLRARLEDAEARWRAAEAFMRPTCSDKDEDGVFCDAPAEWSPADVSHRCTEHTTNEEAKR